MPSETTKVKIKRFELVQKNEGDDGGEECDKEGLDWIKIIICFENQFHRGLFFCLQLKIGYISDCRLGLNIEFLID